jgi:hypothetical protein
MITLVRKSTKADHLARNYANLDQMANYNAKPLVGRHSRCGRPPTGFPGSQQDFRAPMWPTRCKVVAIFAAKSHQHERLVFPPIHGPADAKRSQRETDYEPPTSGALNLSISSCRVNLQSVDSLGEFPGPPGAAAELPEDAPGFELGVRSLAGSAKPRVRAVGIF